MVKGLKTSLTKQLATEIRDSLREMGVNASVHLVDGSVRWKVVTPQCVFTTERQYVEFCENYVGHSIP